jgi:hypothetical protein
MCSARDNAALPTLGFPIRASAGHWLFSASPRLIAAVHALHRLLVPRHPPCALTILTDTNACGDRGDSQASHHVGKDLVAFSRSAKPDCPLWHGCLATASPLQSRPISARQKAVQAFYLYPLHWKLCSFQGPRRGELTTRKPGTEARRPPAVSRSLKTQQHAKTRKRVSVERISGSSIEWCQPLGRFGRHI